MKILKTIKEKIKNLDSEIKEALTLFLMFWFTFFFVVLFISGGEIIHSLLIATGGSGLITICMVE